MLFQQHGASAITQGESEQPAQPESKSHGRCPADHVAGIHVQDMARKQVTHGQHIAVKMHCAFGLTCCPAGEGNQTDIIPRSGVRSERLPVHLHSRFKPIRSLSFEVNDLFQYRCTVRMVWCHAMP